jgi:hypothetical protein
MFMRKLCIVGALCAVLLAGCDLGGGGSSAATTSDSGTTASTTSTGTDTTTSSSTTTTGSSAPTATPTSSIPQPTACGTHFPSGIYGYIGAMLISTPAFGGLSYLGLRLPDNMPSGQPYAEATRTVTSGNYNPTSAAVYATSNGFPNLGDRDAGFVVTICNSSTTMSHVLHALGAQITGFTSAAGVTTDAQVGCDSAVSATMGPEGGCGGSIGGGIDAFHATWPAGAGIGTTVTLTQTENSASGLGGGGFPNLPVTLKPGASYTAFIGMNYPGQPGNYTFQFGMQVDSVPLATVGANTKPLLLATGISEWSGATCYANTAWKAIVKAHPKNWYVCPA